MSPSGVDPQAASSNSTKFTLHSPVGLGKSLKTTNCIESLMALIGQRTDKVDYWRNSNQKQRWLATALLDIEPRLNRIRGYRYFPELRTAIQIELGIRTNEVVAA